jgi:hypothetical protein
MLWQPVLVHVTGKGFGKRVELNSSQMPVIKMKKV